MALPFAVFIIVIIGVLEDETTSDELEVPPTNILLFELSKSRQEKCVNPFVPPRIYGKALIGVLVKQITSSSYKRLRIP